MLTITGITEITDTRTVTSDHIWAFLSDLFCPNQIHLLIYHISSTKCEAQCL